LSYRLGRPLLGVVRLLLLSIRPLSHVAQDFGCQHSAQERADITRNDGSGDSQTGQHQNAGSGAMGKQFSLGHF
jgi:hypothetical protein